MGAQEEIRPGIWQFSDDEVIGKLTVPHGIREIRIASGVKLVGNFFIPARRPPANDLAIVGEGEGAQRPIIEGRFSHQNFKRLASSPRSERVPILESLMSQEDEASLPNTFSTVYAGFEGAVAVSSLRLLNSDRFFIAGAAQFTVEKCEIRLQREIAHPNSDGITANTGTRIFDVLLSVHDDGIKIKGKDVAISETKILHHMNGAPIQFGHPDYEILQTSCLLDGVEIMDCHKGNYHHSALHWTNNNRPEIPPHAKTILITGEGLIRSVGPGATAAPTYGFGRPSPAEDPKGLYNATLVVRGVDSLKDAHATPGQIVAKSNENTDLRNVEIVFEGCGMTFCVADEHGDIVLSERRKPHSADKDEQGDAHQSR